MGDREKSNRKREGGEQRETGRKAIRKERGRDRKSSGRQGKKKIIEERGYIRSRRR